MVPADACAERPSVLNWPADNEPSFVRLSLSFIVLHLCRLSALQHVEGEINKTAQTKPGCLYKHPWHIFTFTESICKHASLLQCLFCLSGTFTPLLIPLSIYHLLLSSSRASWPCNNERPAHLHACKKGTLNWHRHSKNCSFQTCDFCTSWEHNCRIRMLQILPSGIWYKTNLSSHQPFPCYQVPKPLYGLMTFGLFLKSFLPEA